MKDYYSILEITENASEEVVRAAYRALAKKYHPDTSTNKAQSEQKMLEINEAYSTLSDENKRARYDYERKHSFQYSDLKNDKNQSEKPNDFNSTQSGNSRSKEKQTDYYDVKKEETSNQSTPKSSFNHWGVVLVCLVIAVVCVISYSVNSKKRISNHSAYYNNTVTSTTSTTTSTVNISAVSTTTSVVEKEKPKEFFTLGDTQEKVKKIMGTPDRIDHYDTIGDTWHYGFSSVSFNTSGKVEGWNSNDANELYVSMGNKVDGKEFTWGSSGSEVVAAMGTPNRIDHYNTIGDIWYYGFSSVSFNTDGEVDGWNSWSNSIKLNVNIGTKKAGCYFTLGSSSKEVIMAMGTPDRIDHYSTIGDTWYYGTSSISFDAKGYVVDGWRTGNVSLNVE